MILKNKLQFTNDLDSKYTSAKYLDHGYELAIPVSPGTVVKRYAYVKDLVGNYIELLEPAEG